MTTDLLVGGFAQPGSFSLEHIGQLDGDIALEFDVPDTRVYDPIAVNPRFATDPYIWRVKFTIPQDTPLPKNWRGCAFMMTFVNGKATYEGLVFLWRRGGWHRGVGRVKTTWAATQKLLA